MPIIQSLPCIFSAFFFCVHVCVFPHRHKLIPNRLEFRESPSPRRFKSSWSALKLNFCIDLCGTGANGWLHGPFQLLAPRKSSTLSRSDEGHVWYSHVVSCGTIYGNPSLESTACKIYRTFKGPLRNGIPFPFHMFLCFQSCFLRLVFPPHPNLNVQSHW